VEWAGQVEIQLTNNIKLQDDSAGGLGWFSGASNLPPSSVLLTVPSKVALTIEAPGAGPDDSTVSKLISSAKGELPWYIQMALYIHKLDRISSKKGELEMRPWLDSLPRQFDTPIHWPSLDELQYDYMAKAVRKQEQDWKAYYSQFSNVQDLDWNAFLWGAEVARSRAFSGAYTGTAFNPLIYAFTLLLVTAYVGLGLGSLEQAANGAGVVLCVTVLKDFVVPKLFKKKRFVICPLIDMANHDSTNSQGEVSFEYFGNAYSLAMSWSGSLNVGEQLFISYGTRSNDQLLQYYGFVEVDNPNDVYVMPPLRDWDISALEIACGRKFAEGRLVRLERAGLLGGTEIITQDEDTTEIPSKRSDAVANRAGGVVLARVTGIDPAVLQALRALVSTDEEWADAGEAIGTFCEKYSEENETCAKAAARKAIEIELKSKPTTIDQDVALLKQQKSTRGLDMSREDLLAILFRIEKKKVLVEAMDML
jgi:hypothetical protein